MHDIFAIDTISVSDLGDTIIKEAQGQLHSDPYNLDVFKTNMNSTVAQLPTFFRDTVNKFVGDFESNYGALLNQRVVIGQILKGQVAPAAEARELQIKDTFQ